MRCDLELEGRSAADGWCRPGSGAATEADAFAALERAFAAEARAAGRRDAGPTAGAGSRAGLVPGGNGTREDDTASAFDALERAFAAEARADASPAVGDGLNGEPATGGSGERTGPAEDPFEALDRAFAAEAAALAAGNGGDRSAGPAPSAGATGAAPGRAAEPPADFAGWVRAVNAAVTAAEAAAGAADGAAAGDGGWFARTTACLEARDRLEAASGRVRELTVGDARPAWVTPAAGRDAYAELRERVEAAGRRGRETCDRIERPR